MKIVIRRSELLAHGACKEGLEFFRTIAPKGILKVEWSPLVQCWLAVEARQFISWAICHNIIPIANLYGANLESANLYGANLESANLVRANLYGANLENVIYPYDVSGWKSVNGILRRL